MLIIEEQEVKVLSFRQIVVASLEEEKAKEKEVGSAMEEEVCRTKVKARKERIKARKERAKVRKERCKQQIGFQADFPLKAKALLVLSRAIASSVANGAISGGNAGN